MGIIDSLGLRDGSTASTRLLASGPSTGCWRISALSCKRRVQGQAQARRAEGKRRGLLKAVRILAVRLPTCEPVRQDIQAQVHLFFSSNPRKSGTDEGHTGAPLLPKVASGPSRSRTHKGSGWTHKFRAWPCHAGVGAPPVKEEHWGVVGVGAPSVKKCWCTLSQEGTVSVGAPSVKKEQSVLVHPQSRRNSQCWCTLCQEGAVSVGAPSVKKEQSVLVHPQSRRNSQCWCTLCQGGTVSVGAPSVKKEQSVLVHPLSRRNTGVGRSSPKAQLIQDGAQGLSQPKLMEDRGLNLTQIVGALEGVSQPQMEHRRRSSWTNLPGTKPQMRGAQHI